MGYAIRINILLFLVSGLGSSQIYCENFAKKALEISTELQPGVEEGKYLQWVDDLANELLPKISTLRPEEKIEEINRLIFIDLGFRVQGSLETSESLFLDRVIEKKAGYCVGLATLYLALGEKLQIPFFAVAAPSHVFIRYENEMFRRNIELTEKGRSLSDEEYIRRFRIHKKSIEDGVFLRNLSHHEFLGQILNNRGVLASQNKNYGEAEKDYKNALSFDPILQAVYYNRGSDRIRQGRLKKARRDLSRAIELNPNDHEAWNNSGVCLLKMGKSKLARENFKKALEIKPDFQHAHENLRSLEQSNPDELKPSGLP